MSGVRSDGGVSVSVILQFQCHENFKIRKKKRNQTPEISPFNLLLTRLRGGADVAFLSNDKRVATVSADRMWGKLLAGLTVWH